MFENFYFVKDKRVFQTKKITNQRVGISYQLTCYLNLIKNMEIGEGLMNQFRVESFWNGKITFKIKLIIFNSVY